MTVEIETRNHATSSEKQDHLDQSKKKVKSNDANYVELLEIQANTLDKPNEPMVEEADVGNGNIDKLQEDNLGTHRSFKQALLRSRFNETKREHNFDCEAAYFSSDEEMDNEDETEDASENQGNVSIPIIKLLAGLLKKIRKLWNLQASFETLDIGNGFFIVKFEVMEDYSKVFTGGPWVVMDRYVTVQKWQPDFKSDEAEEDTTAIWVRFPNLPIEYYDEKSSITL
ncbi:hypothetical protein ACSBR2_018967 [Camellia fascicularis]